MLLFFIVRSVETLLKVRHKLVPSCFSDNRLVKGIICFLSVMVFMLGGKKVIVHAIFSYSSIVISVKFSIIHFKIVM